MQVTIVKAREFESDLKKHFKDIARGDEAVEGLEWVLGRCPTHGTLIEGTKVRATPIYPDNQPFLVYYNVNGERLTLLAILPIEEEVGFL